MSNRLKAVINCGSSSIRMIIGEFTANGAPQVIDQAIHYLPMGKDVFTTGMISNKTMARAMEILKLYRELLKGYGIEPSQVQAVGTAAVREALNRENFVDRMEIRTGFPIRIIDGLEENRLSYMAVLYALEKEVGLLSRGNTLIMEVSGGSTEVIVLKKGIIGAVHSLSFGAIRFQELYRQKKGYVEVKSHELEQSLSSLHDLIHEDCRHGSVNRVFLLGNYARIAAEMVGKGVSARLLEVEHRRWNALAEELYLMPPEDIVNRYGIAAAAADGMGTALLAYRYLLKDIDCESILVPRVGISEGILMEARPGVDPEVQSRFWNQVRNSALALGKKYHFDAEHAKLVARLSVELFDQLASEHRMGLRHRLLLEIAALLHDIGTFVKPSAHHKHGQYLVENSELFGLDAHDLKIIGNVVRYHRKSTPQNTHLGFVSLNREDRLVVMKMAALLRVADSLDRSHSQKVTDVKAIIKEEVMELQVFCDQDLDAEKLSLVDKGSFFEDVFGFSIRILQIRKGEKV